MTLTPDYFDALYAAAEDPWGFADRWYEQRKYALTLASLPEERYATAYEPGCSIGVLTGLLAGRSDDLLASDGSAAAVQRAARRLSGHAHVTVEQRRLPEQWPDRTFDLVVLSELLYYFAADDLRLVVDSAIAAVNPGGTLVAVHWRHPAVDHPQTCDEVHARLTQAAVAGGLARLAGHVEDDFLLDVWVRPPTDGAGSSVAARTGLVA
jgi:SAM-dependent methyltransferase